MFLPLINHHHHLNVHFLPWLIKGMDSCFPTAPDRQPTFSGSCLSMRILERCSFWRRNVFWPHALANATDPMGWFLKKKYYQCLNYSTHLSTRSVHRSQEAECWDSWRTRGCPSWRGRPSRCITCTGQTRELPGRSERLGSWPASNHTEPDLLNYKCTVNELELLLLENFKKTTIGSIKWL